MNELIPLVEKYLKRCRNVRRLSANTIDAYENDLAQFTARHGSQPEVTAETIRACLTKIAEDKRLAPTSVKRKVASVRAFLRDTNAELAAETFSKWKLSIRMPARLPKAISKIDLMSLLKTAKADTSGYEAEQSPTHLCLSLLAATGLRISELCSLRIGQVRPSTGEIAVFGKGSRERVAIIANSEVRRALADYIRTLSDSENPEAPLFRNRRGRPMTPQCLRLRLHSIRRDSSVHRNVTPHMLRHTAATLLLEGGVDIRFVQRLLGHASIATTQIYTHVTDVALRRALEKADVMRALV